MKHKYLSLDSLRGIAALMVCLWHYYLVDHPVDILGENAKPWLLLNAGPEAVILFFVLTSMLESSLNINYKHFILRRVFRIYPSYYCAMILSIGFFMYTKPLPILELTSWFNSYSESSLGISLFIRTVLLIIGVGNSFNNVTWSLTYEMVISLIFPLIYYTFLAKGSFRDYNKNQIMKCVLLIIAYLIIFKSIFGIRAEYNLYYMHFFIIGSLVYKYKNSLNKFSKGFYLLLGLILYFSKFLTFGYFQNEFIYNELTLIGSCIIIINAIYNERFSHVLSISILKFYGKISYSFYLLHLPILYACVYIFYKEFNLDLNIVKVVSFIFASLSSYFLYKYVELYFIKFSKKLISSY